MLEDPAVDNIASIVGVDGANNTMLNAGTMLVDIKPGASGTQEEIMNRLRQRAQAVAGITLYVQPTQDLTIDSDTGPTQYRVSLEGADDATVALWANKLVERLRSDTKVRNVVTDVGSTGLAVEVDLDRDTASRLGISAATVDDALYSAYGQRIVSTIFTETNQYRVILEARPDQATTPASIGDLRVLTTGGARDAAVGVRDDPHGAVAAAGHARGAVSRLRPSASTRRTACRWARRSTRSARPPRTSPCPRR